MKAGRIFAVVLVLTLVLTEAVAETRRVVLVVRMDSPVTHLDSTEVRKLFLRLPVRRDDTTLRPVFNASDPQLERVFLQHIVAMSQTAYDRRILGEFVRTGRPRPETLPASELVLAELQRDRYAISYLWAHEVAGDPRFRAVRVLWQE